GPRRTQLSSEVGTDRSKERPHARGVASGAGPASSASGGGTREPEEPTMRKIFGVVVFATALIGSASVAAAQSSRGLTEPPGKGHGGEPHKDPNRGLLLSPWASRVCVRAAPAPTMALVAPALVICRSGSQRR